MSLFSDFMVRARALFFRNAEDREMDDEVRFHLERDAQERIRNGRTPDVARREALLAFGGVERYKEQMRDARGTRPLEELGADIRYALRGLRRNPGFALTGILVLGVGIGATSTVYSVVHSVILADLPYPEPERLVRVVERNSPTNSWVLSTADVIAIRERQRVFAEWGEMGLREVALSGVGTPQRIRVTPASSGYFRTVGIPVAKGRAIQPSDEVAEASEVVVVTDAFARRVLGGADAAIGRSIMLDGVAHTVVGVLPPGQNEMGGVRSEVWPALKLRPIVRRGPFWLRGLGRLKPGTTIEAAAADLSRISAEILPLWTDFRDSTAKLTPQSLREVIVGRSLKQVSLFAGAVGLVLMLAIVNVATLVLVRASAREQELAVRVMLGARRGRLARLLVTENLILTFSAAVVGLLIAVWGVDLAVSQLSSIPRIQNVAVDWRVILLGVGAAVVSGVLVSLSPIAALRARTNLAARATGARTDTGHRTNRLRAAFVTAQFALAWPLLVASGLLLNSFLRLQQVDPGFQPQGLVTFGVNLPTIRYDTVPEIFRFRAQALQRVASLPAVAAAGMASDVPPDPNYGAYDNFNLVHRPVPDGQAEPSVPWYYVGSTYFETLGIRILEGRNFTDVDTAAAFPVVIVSESWARQFLPGESAVGRQLVQGGCYDCPRTTIIGVVEDVRNLGPAAPMIAAYGTLMQSATPSVELLVRFRSLTPTAVADVRDALRGLDPELPLVETVITEKVAESTADPMRWAAVLTAFAASGLGLAALGVFGLMAYSVRQRRRELGVRLALGANPSTVTRLVVSRGMRYALVGSAIGLGITVLLVGRLQTMLFGVQPMDVATFVVVGVLLGASALLASWIPGRRAARIRPIEAIGSGN
jgi:putative ABC transport system permease protein